MQKDTHDHDENVPLMREESSDGKVTTAGYYKVRCCWPSSHSSTMCLNLRVIFRPWVLVSADGRKKWESGEIPNEQKTGRVL